MKIAINGFGRIGRMTMRALLAQPGAEVVAINDLADIETLAHLFKFDSAHGKFAGTVTINGNNLVINGQSIRLVNERNPENLPWKELDVYVVIESTGRFTARDQAAAHLTAGAKKVLITAPASGGVKTIVDGVNNNIITPEDTILSTASCTTNCIAPVLHVLDNAYGIESGYMSTIHAYTMDQMLQDGPHRDLRRARAAAQSIIPTTTGAAKAIGEVLPNLKGRLDGHSFRVPVIDGSIAELTVNLRKTASVDEINALLQQHANGELQGILDYTTEPLVSADIIGNTHSSIVDSQLTRVIGNTAKVVAWYDNEVGISNRIAALVTSL
ncbi:type I glyceraldehyde-3-phosphate dehydrogenase [Chitinophaga sp. sic0106]|uniref:type I glyceraldehyde-3-phosphate dehydrogenase n=1 Tax=Chitinophaga sp. sic0106 TaxID=2854785 RepID=UPI001C448BD8|nr:type I glyceraldehyde-3-phosphate dehydrogenase [Chitinophaga sp. sic0106]MBV7531396.1 type I glyceraldehyde-3-phosphate dehydrogenase [Chitinophaga sp. sic0106]